MRRYHFKFIREWFYRDGRKPLILRGARQVGKSTLIRLFADEEGLELLEVNLERGKIKSVEKEHIKIEEVLDEIQIRTQKRLHEKSLIFFDEIQEQPNLLKFLRYFYEEKPEIAVVSAGSL
ncbi:MAG: AAA family ATPase, partial [Bdellovibrio sp.]